LMTGSRLDLLLWSLRNKASKLLLNAGAPLFNKETTLRITTVALIRPYTSPVNTLTKMPSPKLKPLKLSSRRRTQILNSQRRLSQKPWMVK
jgi:hypothetical protein